jgi:hypothetical protein
MTTRKQLESAIVRLSIELDGAKDWAAHQDKMADKHWMAWRESCREVEALLAENAELRATAHRIKMTSVRFANAHRFGVVMDDAIKHALQPKPAKGKKARRK